MLFQKINFDEKKLLKLKKSNILREQFFVPENKKMDDLMDMIIADETPSQISDKIKDILFSKSAEKIDAFRPEVASSLFGETEEEYEEE